MINLAMSHIERGTLIGLAGVLVPLVAASPAGAWVHAGGGSSYGIGIALSAPATRVMGRHRAPTRAPTAEPPREPPRAPPPRIPTARPRIPGPSTRLIPRPTARRRRRTRRPMGSPTADRRRPITRPPAAPATARTTGPRIRRTRPPAVRRPITAPITAIPPIPPTIRPPR